MEIIYGMIEKAGKLKSLMILQSPPRIDETQFLKLVDARKKARKAPALEMKFFGDYSSEIDDTPIKPT